MLNELIIQFECALSEAFGETQDLKSLEIPSYTYNVENDSCGKSYQLRVST